MLFFETTNFLLSRKGLDGAEATVASTSLSSEATLVEPVGFFYTIAVVVVTVVFFKKFYERRPCEP